MEQKTFARMSDYYSERVICEIVWLVASEHLYNMTNIGLNIHSDGLCDVIERSTPDLRSPQKAAPRAETGRSPLSGNLSFPQVSAHT